jgi:hypothetical protein
MTMADSHNAFQRLMLNYPRRFGAVLALFGAVLCNCNLVLPIQQAVHGKSEIKISGKAGMLGVILTVFRLSYVVFGARSARIFQPSAQDSKVPTLTVGILLAIFSLLIYVGVTSYLERKGYVLTR